MDILKELNEVPVSLRGLNRQAVEELIGKILKECEQDKDTTMAELVRQNQTLQTELKETKEHLQDFREQNRELMKHMTSMSESLEKGTEYSKTRDRELDEYRKKEKEIENLLENTRQEANEERIRILDEVEAKRSSLLMDVETEKADLLSGARAEAAAIIEKARAEADHMRQEADQTYQELLERSIRVRKYLDEMKNRMMLLFSWEEEHLDAELEEAGAVMEKEEEAESVTEASGEEAVTEKAAVKMEETAVEAETPESLEEAVAAARAESDMVPHIVDVSNGFPAWDDQETLVLEPDEA